MALKPQEIEFANNYIVDPNAYQAALKAGYKESTAKYAYEWIAETLSNSTVKRHLPYKPELHEHILELMKPDEKTENAILTRARKKELLAEFANNPENSITDRLKAIDLDNKMDGEYTNNLNIEGNINNPFKGLTTEQLEKLAGGCD